MLANYHKLLEFTEKLALEAGLSSSHIHFRPGYICLKVSCKAPCLGIQAQIMLGGGGSQTENLFQVVLSTEDGLV